MQKLKKYLQYFHHDFLIVCNVYGFKYFAVLSSAQLSHKLVVILISEAQKRKIFNLSSLQYNQN